MLPSCINHCGAYWVAVERPRFVPGFTVAQRNVRQCMRPVFRWWKQWVSANWRLKVALARGNPEAFVRGWVDDQRALQLYRTRYRARTVQLRTTLDKVEFLVRTTDELHERIKTLSQAIVTDVRGRTHDEKTTSHSIVHDANDPQNV